MNIKLRRWQENDLNSLVKNANNKKIFDNERDLFPYPYFDEDGKQFLAMCKGIDERKTLILAIEVDGSAVGSIGLNLKDDVYSKCAEIGYWLGEPYWNNGIATEAVKMICQKGFSDYDIVRIQAEVFDYNYASQKVLDKCKFVLEGRLKKNVYKNGCYHDSLIYGLLGLSAELDSPMFVLLKQIRSLLVNIIVKPIAEKKAAMRTPFYYRFGCNIIVFKIIFWYVNRTKIPFIF